MKKRSINCVLLVVTLLFVSTSAFAAAKKVILDTDMVNGYDDGVAMIVLANTMRDNPGLIQFLGVTVVAGNQTQPRGFAHGVRQLQIIGAENLVRADGTRGIPIYMGSRYGLRAGRMDKDVMENERKITGGWIYTGYFQWVTNADRSADVNYDPMQPWNQFYENNYTSQFGGETALKPDGTPTYPYAFYPAQRDGTKAHADARGIDNAVDFIIDTINSNPPHTVSILAIGPLTNVALALRKDPSIAERAKEIVYMGGSFYMKGNATNAAEFNWWADPESAKMCVRTPWGDKTSPEFALYGNQVISGLEVHINLKPIPTSADSTLPPTGTNYSREQESWFDQSQWFYDRIQTEIYSNIRRLPTAAVWDVIAAGWLIDPAATTRWYNSGSENPVTSNSAMAGVKVDVDTNYTENYGRSLPFFDNNGSQTGPAGTQKAAIQADIDQVKFWNDIVAPALIDPSKTVPTPADDYDP